MARTAWVDATFSAWVAVAIMLGFDLVESGTDAETRRDRGGDPAPPDRDRWRAPCFWLCLAGATLTKGPLGVVLPGLTLLVWSLVRRRPASLRSLFSPGMMVLAAVLVGAWYGAAYVQHGYDFIDKQIVKSYFQRFLSRDPDSPRAQPLWYFFVYFFSEAFPTSALFPFAAWDAIRHRRCNPDDVSPGCWTLATGKPSGHEASPAERRAELRLFLVLWVVVLVAFFSLSAGKRKVYLLPCDPAVALLSADWVLRRTRSAAPAQQRRRRRLLAAGMTAAFVWAAAVQPRIDRQRWGACSYKAFAREVARRTDEPIAAVGVASYFPLTVYLMPHLRFFVHFEDVPPEAREVLVASETLAGPESLGKRQKKPWRSEPQVPPGWEVALSTQARSGFAKRHPVLLLKRKAA
jgi:4-amino-4-deoxy-L-arabinose transferase-like glycosyltransferase